MDKAELILKLREGLAEFPRWKTIRGLTRKITDDLYDLFLAESLAWDQERVRKFQEQRLRQLLQHVYTNVPFYKSWFDSNSIAVDAVQTLDDLRLIPPVSKQDFKKFTKEYTTAANISSGRFSHRTTSGSTSEPFSFYLDKRYAAFKNALLRRFFKLWGIPAGLPFVLVADPDFRFPFPTALRVSIFDFLKEPVSILSRMNNLGHSVVVGYASGLHELAVQSIKHNIYPKPAAVVSFAEQLAMSTRRLITKALRCRIYNYYAATETGIIGFECGGNEGFHINEEALILEILPYSDSSYGIGEVVVTSLVNEAMPFIRYRLGDIGNFINESCACGLPRKKVAIQGRKSAIFKTKKRRIHEFEFNNVLQKFHPYIETFRISRVEPQRMVITVTGSGFNRKIGEKIISELKTRIDPELEYNIEYAAHPERSPHGKLRGAIM